MLGSFRILSRAIVLMQNSAVYQITYARGKSLALILFMNFSLRRVKAVGLLFSTIFSRCFYILEGEMAFSGQNAVVNPTSKHTATVIFLHGLGDTGHGWSAAFESIRSPNVKYLCPTAGVSPVSLNNGYRMPSWFDIKSLDPDIPEDDAGIRKASEELKKVIEEEEKSGIPTNKIVIGGFSQGGALSLYTALTYPKKLAGVLALSSWIPLRDDFNKIEMQNRETPILQCHGDSDPLIPFKIGFKTSQVLKERCSKHEFKKYTSMGHSSCPEEMMDIQRWLRQVLSA